MKMLRICRPTSSSDGRFSMGNQRSRDVEYLKPKRACGKGAGSIFEGYPVFVVRGACDAVRGMAAFDICAVRAG